MYTTPADATIHHATKAKAEKLGAMLAAEYPALALLATTSEGRVDGFRVVATIDGEETEVLATPKVPDLADVLEACEDLDIDPTAQDEDDEPKTSGSVVPEHYRQQYRAASTNGQTCGDWLAEWLVNETHSKNGLVVDDLTAIFEANQLDLSKGWGQLPYSGQKGWVGRYRMNGRQVLEKVVAKTGLVRDAQGNAIQPPEAFLATMQAKHGKWLAKQAKLEAAALATAGKDEGEAEA